jgi:hypothetical protein
MSEQQPPTPPEPDGPYDTEDELVEPDVADEGAEAPPEDGDQDDGQDPEPDADEPEPEEDTD